MADSIIMNMEAFVRVGRQLPALDTGKIVKAGIQNPIMKTAAVDKRAEGGRTSHPSTVPP